MRVQPRLEAAVPEIRAEYDALATGRPSDYAPGESDHDRGLHSGGEWHWASLIDKGRVQEEAWARCPRTAEALSSIPGLCVGEMPFAFAFFSTLRAGTRIAAHTSPCNLRLRVHLALKVPEPESCGMLIAGEARQWREGEAVVFDDAFEHEARRPSCVVRSWVPSVLDCWSAWSLIAHCGQRRAAGVERWRVGSRRPPL